MANLCYHKAESETRMKLKEFLKKSQMKPFDGIIIVLLILLSFLPLVLFSLKQAGLSDTVTYEAKISVDGKTLKTFPLKKGQGTLTYRYEDEDGDYNLIEVVDDKIHITEANCGDLVCVRQGFIEKSGDTIVCLPHKLLIEVIASDGSEDGSVIY